MWNGEWWTKADWHNLPLTRSVIEPAPQNSMTSWKCYMFGKFFLMCHQLHLHLWSQFWQPANAAVDVSNNSGQIWYWHGKSLEAIKEHSIIGNFWSVWLESSWMNNIQEPKPEPTAPLATVVQHLNCTFSFACHAKAIPLHIRNSWL